MGSVKEMQEMMLDFGMITPEQLAGKDEEFEKKLKKQAKKLELYQEALDLAKKMRVCTVADSKTETEQGDSDYVHLMKFVGMIKICQTQRQ